MGVITTLCSAVYVTIDRVFEKKVTELNKGIDSRLIFVEMYTQDQIIKNILKQGGKISRGEVEDIKNADIEDALKYYGSIKEPIPDNVKVSYELILEYYKNNF